MTINERAKKAKAQGKSSEQIKAELHANPSGTSILVPVALGICLFLLVLLFAIVQNGGTL